MYACSKVISIDLTILSWDVAWNIIGKEKWISWIWSISWVSTTWLLKTVDSSSRTFNQIDDVEVNTFLQGSDWNYLVLLNIWNINLKYNLKANNSWEFFTRPETTIISSAQVWNYKQNLSTELDNTDFLDMLKYSIYSN